MKLSITTTNKQTNKQNIIYFTASNIKNKFEHCVLTSVDAISSRPFSKANHNGASPLSFTTDMSAPLVQMASTTSGS